MRLIFERTRARFECVCSFQEKDTPKQARFRWDPAAKRWWTGDETIAARLAKYADQSCGAELAAIAERREASLAASRAAESDLEVPCPDGLSFLPYQIAGIAYASSRPATLLADQMGLGKTIQALGLINLEPETRTVLVVCPASLKINWARESEKWLTRSFTIEIIDPKQVRTMREGDGVHRLRIINYDILHRHPEMSEQECDLLIGDEVHYCKSAKARRSKAFYSIKARRRLYLTGTPILNRPAEIFPIIKALDPGRWSNFMRFARRYCAAQQRWVTGTKQVWDFSGSSNTPELQEILRETIMVRRLKKHVLKELPPKYRQVVEFTPDRSVRSAIGREQDDYRRSQAHLAELRAAVERSGTNDDDEKHRAAVTALRDGVTAAFSQMSLVRHDTAVAKVPSVIAHLRTMLDGGVGKVVCFAHHHDVIDALAAEFGDEAVTLTGRDAQSKRQAAVDRFQTDPACLLFIGNMKAAGVGLTLTASSHVVFAELDWVPATVSQAEDRCHRIGTTDNVLVQHLVFEGSLDATMAKRIIDKQRVIDAALDDIPKPMAAQAATGQSASRARIAREAAELTPDQVIAVHTALRILAGMCDGACSRDDAGFNKMDSRIGHELAGLDVLTPKQAAFGRRIALKYHRQLGAELVDVIKKVSPTKPNVDAVARHGLTHTGGTAYSAATIGGDVA